MSGLGQVGGPSRPPTSPSGVIAGNADSVLLRRRIASLHCATATATVRVRVRMKEGFPHAYLTAADKHSARHG
jgi:hypothetical protein